MLNELQMSLISIAGSVVASVGISLLLFSLLPKKDNNLREDVKNLENRINELEKNNRM